MKAQDFIVFKRPRLSSITKHRKIALGDYERRLALMQSTAQAIQQAYLGTRERAVMVLEGWDTAGKGGIVRRLGWALDARSFKVHPISAPSSHERSKHYLQRFWEKLPEHGRTCQLGAELTCCAEFNVIGEEHVIDGTRAALDDDAVSLQHEPRNQPVFTKQACDHNKQAYEHDEDDR